MASGKITASDYPQRFDLIHTSDDSCEDQIG